MSASLSLNLMESEPHAGHFCQTFLEDNHSYTVLIWSGESFTRAFPESKSGGNLGDSVNPKLKIALFCSTPSRI